MAWNKILLSDNVTPLDNVKNVTYTEIVNTSEYLRPGCVSSASIEVEIYDNQANAVSSGDVVYLYYIDKNNTQTLMGSFNCNPTIETKNSYKFTAYDNVIKLDADFSQWLSDHQSAFPMTVGDLVQNACTVAGVTLGNLEWELSGQTVQAFYAEGIKCRDVLSYAAELGCYFVRCHSDGKIYFDWYLVKQDVIAPSVGTNQYAYKQNGLNYANYTTTALARVAVHPSGMDDVAYVYPTGITSGNTLHIKDNLLLAGADSEFYNMVAQNVFTAMSALGTYKPMTVNVFVRENPFRAGDIVSVTDSQGISFTAPLTGMTVSDNSATLESVGRQEYEDTTNTQKALTQLAFGVKKARSIAQLASDLATLAENGVENLTVDIQNVSEEFSASLVSLDSTLRTELKQEWVADINVGDEHLQAAIEAVSSSLTQTATEIRQEFVQEDLDLQTGILNTIATYIQSTADGILVGRSDSPVKLRITNARIEIIENDEVITYWSNVAQVTPGELIVPQGGSFSMGNFRFVPRSSGNLSIVKV